MPSSHSFNLGEQESLQGLTTKNTGCLTRKTIIIGIIVVVAILALGLGLGLGLRKTTDPQPTGETCEKFNMGQFSVRLAEGTHGSTWLNTDCALPDKPQCPKGFEKPPLLIVSMDGFRADYLTRNLTPVLEKIANCGVRADYIRSAFPTKTFPNHYSIVTGLYPESHGIIDNTMVDLEMKQVFTLAGKEKMDPRWWHGEPIWVSARKAGKKSATMFWPGSEIKINGYYPNRCYWFDDAVPFEMRVDRVLAWLDEPADIRPDVINLYFNQPDSAGHKQGPDGDWVNGNVTRLDKLMGDMMDELIKRNLHKCIDIIITSDHGMTPVSKKKVVDIRAPLNKLLKGEGFAFDGTMGRITSKYAVRSINPPTIEKVENGVSADEIVEALECVNYNTTADYNSKVFKKGDLPVRAHYALSPRIEEVVVTLRDEWQLYGGLIPGVNGGAHGYDNIYPSMRPMFMAYGSSFKEKLTVKPFENIELYNLMADILQINPAPNNGTSGRLYQMLRHPPSPPTAAPPGSEYKSAKFPDDASEMEKRRGSSDCNCTDGIEDVEAADLRLNLTEAGRAAAVSRHLGDGNTPVLGQEGLQVWSLVQEDYVSAYSRDHHMPLWAAFTLDEKSGSDLVNLSASCSRVDVRLETADLTKCADYSDSTGSITPSYLVPPGIVTSPNKADMQISTNIVPMYTTFREGVWRTMMEVLADYRTKYQKVNVLVGPVFDNDHNGLADDPKTLKMVPGSTVPLPTHFYIMLTTCSDKSVEVSKCPGDKLQLLSAILPHLNKTGNCWDAGDSKPFEYLQNNVARPRDVELITGVTLLQGVSDANQQLELRTHLEVGLWDRTSWLDQEECPKFDASTCPMGADNIPVLLISVDGFRADYMERGASPVLEKLGNCGVRAPYLQSAYPSLTFPNHYTLVTGLHPESHGIVENNMFDLKINRTFKLGSPNAFDTRWWGGEPLWNTAVRNNKSAGVFFWPGSDVEIGGMRPNEYFVYDGNVPYSKRVDKVIDWLTGRRGLQTQLAILYMDKVDKAGHEYGPNSEGVTDAIRYVDGYLQNLMDGLHRANLDHCVNIIVTADHGMTNISCQRGIQLADYMPYDQRRKTNSYTGGAGRLATTYSYDNNHYRPVPEEDRVSVDMVVHNTSCQSEHMHVFSLQSLPKRFHYTNNARIGEVIFVMDDEWSFNRVNPWCGIKGQHGWDPMTYDSMKAVFRSYGPGFKQNYTSPPFENIEIYNLITDLLSISGAPNNGTKGSLNHLLSNELPAPPPGGYENYTTADYPATDEVYDNRTTSSGCNCSVPNGKTVKQYDEQLKLTEAERKQLSQRHLPSGRPTVDGQVALQSLWQKDYVSAYSPVLGLPLWSAYTVNNQTFQSAPAWCLRPDVRLEVTDQPSCNDFRVSSDYIDNFLFPPAFASSEDSAYDAYLLTNTVPMLPNFASGIWRNLILLIQKWVQSAGTIHVISGPVFDYDADGIADKIENITKTVGDKGRIPIPSHYFMVMLRCPADNPSNCADMSYETQAFVVEHRANVTNCMGPDEYVWEHRARLRDVELLTGLELLTANSTLSAVRARTFLPRTFGFKDV